MSNMEPNTEPNGESRGASSGEVDVSAPLGVSHLAVGVSDMDRALEFWRDVMALRVDLDTIEEVLGPDGDTRQRRGVYLRSAGERGDDDHTSFVVLDQQLTIDPFGEPSKLFQTGVHHVAFWVDDVEPYRRRALDGGFRCGEPSDADTAAYGQPSGRRVRTVFLRDPDGTFVQLDQRLD